ncbi:GIY-YIG nuclease family protein [Maridesulfovibrio ferrireducens]|nr:GIY-YIG nuclease family protein [Maridesulfovibrio ferrireducens]
MKAERSNIDFPLWRKKVDSSLFEHRGTAIPGWVCDLWCIEEQFGTVRSIKSSDSVVKIKFKEKYYLGNVTYRKAGLKRLVPALWFGDELATELKKTYLMSYMRDIERRLRGEGGKSEIESEIPFWEFLDIEFDCDLKMFIFTEHYSQKPIFPELFKRIVSSPKVKEIDDEVRGKLSRIYGCKWKPKCELDTELIVQNVIYFLLDSMSKKIYVGKADNLVIRLRADRKNIPGWDFYRYEQLPGELAQFTVQIEEMMIRSMAYLLPSSADCRDVLGSDFEFVNQIILVTD